MDDPEMHMRPSRQRGSVIVVSYAADRHGQAVLAALRRQRIPALRLDTAQFPQHLALRLMLARERSGWKGWLHADSGSHVDPSRIRAVWWRRSDPFALHNSVASERWGGTYCACAAAMGAFWKSLSALWVNEPQAEELADLKPPQLALAHRLGLSVPRSCITNDPRVAREFILERPIGETIYKNVSSAPAIGRNTQVARADDRKLLAFLRQMPLLLQERIPEGTDLRVTIVGDDLFSTAIEFPMRRILDWRPEYRRARVYPATLPVDLEQKVRRLARALRLVYAAIDIRRRPDGEHVFLEVNPSGQYLFIEKRTGQPITAALAGLLARGRG